MMRVITQSNLFKRDLENAKKRKFDLSLLKEVVQKLANNEKLEAKYKDHPLKGKFKGLRECHIQPDWLLIYCIDGNEIELLLLRTGTHSDLF